MCFSGSSWSWTCFLTLEQSSCLRSCEADLLSGWISYCPCPVLKKASSYFPFRTTLKFLFGLLFTAYDTESNGLSALQGFFISILLPYINVVQTCFAKKKVVVQTCAKMIGVFLDGTLNWLFLRPLE